MDRKLVSVCIPIYNGEQYIKATVESVLEQTYDNIELILLNDNSTDSTENIILNFNDKRIRYYKNKENLGMVGNWNKAVSYAEGEYIKLLCQDDFLEKNCIEKEAEVFDKNPSVQLVTSASFIIDENGKKLMSRKLFNRNAIVDGKSIIKKSLVLGKNLFGEPTLTMYRKKILDEIGKYDADFWYVPDWDFNIRCLCHGDLYYINEKLSAFRISKTSQTSEIIKNNKKKLLEEDERFINKVIDEHIIILNKFEKLQHNFNTRFRTLLKSVFIKFVN